MHTMLFAMRSSAATPSSSCSSAFIRAPSDDVMSANARASSAVAVLRF